MAISHEIVKCSLTATDIRNLAISVAATRETNKTIQGHARAHLEDVLQTLQRHGDDPGVVHRQRVTQRLDAPCLNKGPDLLRGAT